MNEACPPPLSALEPWQLYWEKLHSDPKNYVPLWGIGEPWDAVRTLQGNIPAKHHFKLFEKFSSAQWVRTMSLQLQREAIWQTQSARPLMDHMCLTRHLWPPDLPGHSLLFFSLLSPSPLLALEFISLFRELWSPSGDNLCCQGVSSHCMFGNPCAEQEDKLWTDDTRGCSSLLVYTHFKTVSLLHHWGQQEQCGSCSPHFSFAACLVPKEQESWWDAGLSRQVKAAL